MKRKPLSGRRHSYVSPSTGLNGFPPALVNEHAYADIANAAIYTYRQTTQEQNKMCWNFSSIYLNTNSFPHTKSYRMTWEWVNDFDWPHHTHVCVVCVCSGVQQVAVLNFLTQSLQRVQRLIELDGHGNFRQVFTNVATQNTPQIHTLVYACTRQTVSPHHRTASHRITAVAITWWHKKHM